jgi:hypothetical protein
MTVRGTFKADALAIGRITVDFLANPSKVHALAALVVESQIAQPLGWCEGSGNMWSPETLTKVRELRDAMERDMARALFATDVLEGTSKTGVIMTSGLGEHLANGARQV